MRPLPRVRQTFIALRATRQAHQIAREIRNPPMGPAESQPPLRSAHEVVHRQHIPYLRHPAQYRYTTVDWIVTVIVLGIADAFLAYLGYLAA